MTDSSQAGQAEESRDDISEPVHLRNPVVAVAGDLDPSGAIPASVPGIVGGSAMAGTDNRDGLDAVHETAEDIL